MAVRFTCDHCNKLLPEDEYIQLNERRPPEKYDATVMSFTFCSLACLSPFIIPIIAKQAEENEKKS